jgi:hypothetical protein
MRKSKRPRVGRILSFAFFISAFILIAAQIVATLVPQAFEPDTGRGLTSFDIYESPWFIGLWIVLGFFILVEFIRSLARFLAPSGSETTPAPKAMTALPGYRRFERRFPTAEFLGSRGVYADEMGPSALSINRFRLSRLAVPAAHLGLLGMLIGGIIGRAGRSNLIEVYEKEMVAIPNTHLELRLDSFTVEYYEGSRMPKLYQSDVTLFGGGHEVFTGSIEVNRPLHFEDLRLYQMTYGASDEPMLMLVHVGTEGGTELVIPLSKDQPVIVEELGVSLLWSTGDEGNVLKLLEGERSRDLIESPEAGSTAEALGRWFEVLELREGRYSGIEIVYLPGVTRLTVGILIFLCAMLLYILFPPSVIWIVGDGDVVHVGVQSRLSYGYQRILKKILGALEE